MRGFQELAKAYDFLLNRALADLQKLFNNEYLETLTIEGCEMHEHLLGITPNSTDSVADRVLRIKGYYASDLPYTENKLYSVLKTMCGADGFELYVGQADQYITIGVKVNSLNLVANVREIAERMKPSNLGLTVRIMYNVHHRFLAYTHADLGKYTHKYLRQGSIFLQDYGTYGKIAKYRHSDFRELSHLDIFAENFSKEA